ncbi:amino acid/polyamine transporter I [Bombardia bombarda]|uniref:Amino acid/polyamine transporter I n=1 Tax=Bombardia bombarda TaxID=252184 RepID=A0AA40C2L8_9PEZI|nr:amino acid/polyamine transporter I [Bombardia bombarda]
MDVDSDDHAGPNAAGTSIDKQDMSRMGKKQQLWRNFRFFSIFGFIMVLMATWEAVLSANIFGLINGGTGGLIWMFIATFFGVFCAILSMAEMASMAPTSGGQYHWVSEFAPASLQKLLSYLVGWLCVLGWQVGTVAISFLMAGQIQGLVILNHDSYDPQRWHLTLITIAIVTISMAFNTVLYRQLPLVEIVSLVLHVLGFFAILIPLWVMGKRADSAYDVFFTFTDGGGWGNTGLSCLIGVLSSIFALIGPDSAAHMSEELRNASKTLPRAMIATMLVNGSMGLVMIVTFCMMVGDVEEVLATPTGQPFIQVFYNAVQNKAGATVMTSIILVITVCGVINNIATSSRQLWAFARDKGVPFSAWFEVVNPKIDLPVNALIFSYVFCVLLSLINIGSAVALNVLTSLGVAALISSYTISVGCMAVKRLRNQHLLPAHFSLGRAGLPLNIIGTLFLLFVFIMSMFPPTPSPDAETMNWSILVYGVVTVFSLVYYFLRGRHRYVGPVSYVRKTL